MKMKIIGLFVSILIISTIIFPVAAITERHDIRATSYDADVPIWKKGDEWTYHFIESRTYGVVYSLSGDLTLKVVEDSGDSYILEGETKPKGAFDLGGYGLKTTRFSSFSMRLQIRKTDLALENILEQIKGFFLITIGPFTLPFPIQIVGNVYVEFEDSWVIMPFPLYDGKSGNLSSVEILHINNYFYLFWGLISVFDPFNSTIPYTPIPYTCSEEQITVDAGSFDVFNVSAEWVDGSRFMSYYSEELGNVAKEVIYIPYGGGSVQYSLILELKNNR